MTAGDDDLVGLDMVQGQGARLWTLKKSVEGLGAGGREMFDGLEVSIRRFLLFVRRGEM